MKPIFISYSSKHRDLTRQLAATLEAQYGARSVWWDHELESWGDYEVQIRNALNEARVVVVIWTKAAGESDWVKSEAGRANRTGKLVNVRPQDTVWEDVPSPYDQHHVDALEDIPGILKSIQAVWEGKPIRTAVPLHEIYFRHHGQRLIDPKRQALPAGIGRIRPTELLQAKFEVIDYSDATGMRAAVLQWCADAKRMAAGRLLHGAGGLGKTRLMIDVAAELRRQGWMAGFLNRATSASEGLLKERWQALEQIIADGEARGVLIVLDYAEGRAEEVTRLTEALLAQEPAATRPLRLVLLGRGAGTWWQALIDEKPEVHRLFYDGEGGIAATELPAIKTGEQRLQFFRHCLDNIKHVLRGQGLAPANQAVASDRMRRIAEGEGFARPLAIQMEALLQLTAATPAAPGIHEQLRAVLGLERDHWAKLLGGLDLAAKRDMGRGVAQVTAVNGVPNRNSAERILMADAFYKGKREARVDVDPVYRNLAAVYGGTDGALVPLEPDLIGEHQVATAGDVELIEGCLSWIEGEPEGEREKKRRDLITVLQRASLDEHGAGAQAQAKALLQHLVKTRLTLLAPEMIAVLIETRGGLEGILTREIAALGDEPLTALDSVLPLHSLALMGVSLAVAHRRVQLAREFLAGADAQAELDEDAKLGALYSLSVRLTNLGLRLSDLGRREEALAASQEAVDIQRRLAEIRPDAFLPALAGSLNNLGIRLSNLGRWEEALAASQEAVDLYRRLAEARPDAFLPDLAGSLNNLGADLSNLGRREEALAASQEAVDIQRRLAETRPDAFLPDLAGSLNNLGLRLSDLGRREEALAASQEAVDFYRRLAEIRPEAFLPNLARSLGAMAQVYASAGEHEAATPVFEEGLTIIAAFVARHPRGFGELVRPLGQLYLAACEKAAKTPNQALLDRVASVLGP